MKINVRASTLDEEIECVWEAIERTVFFDKFGYKVKLPNDEYIETLKDKVRKNELEISDKDKLVQIMNDIYNEEDYQEDINKILRIKSIAEENIEELRKYKEVWGFKIFEEYLTRITLYGAGGGYICIDGTVIMKGKMSEAIALKTLIHEIAHIGIQECIINKYALDHITKEFIVDTFVRDNFKDILPNYKVHDRAADANESIKNIITDGFDWMKLDESLRELDFNKEM